MPSCDAMMTMMTESILSTGYLRLVRFVSKVSMFGAESCQKESETRFVRCPMLAGTSPAMLVSERSRWVIWVSLSNPVIIGSCDMLKLLLERLRWLSEVRLKIAGSTLLACRWWPLKSSEVTRPSAPPQRTPSQRQQSVVATHDRKAVE
uniref:Uncharacterized protein n=1 Tax=Leersia perrieri TaxID=77586 RepID=A0A0D9XXU3_9ORYZ